MRYASKEALLADIRREHDSLCARLDAWPVSRRSEPIWGEGWTLPDLVSHLAEWQNMFLAWYDLGLTGSKPEMPARGHKWNELRLLNQAIWFKHRSRSLDAARADFENGYRRILTIANGLSSEQLLQPGYFKWTGEHALTTYLGANTASHYRFASRIIDRWHRRGRQAPRRKQAWEARSTRRRAPTSCRTA
jgi:hypothetical protein